MADTVTITVTEEGGKTVVVSDTSPVAVTATEEVVQVVQVTPDSPVTLTLTPQADKTVVVTSPVTMTITSPQEVIQVVEITGVGPRGPQGPAGGYQYLDAGGNVNFARPTEGGPWVWGNVPSEPANIDVQDLWIDPGS